ncbi:hypothetical protein ACHAW5_006844 [Stephanodiscus triporus]|uniref:Ribonuclease n=1 Tax=Stephanodiscus triporus TaxID=2934178 RepID=A0ABD3PYV9_9STRA
MGQRPAASVQQRRSARLQKWHLSGVEDSQYRSMNVVELRGLLRERGLAVSGVKSLLVKRLNDYVTNDNLGPNRTIEFSQQDYSNIAQEAKRARAESQLDLSENTLQPSSKTPPLAPSVDNVHCLPRTRELQLLAAPIVPDTNLAVIGVDEAGRGPLAGPVVAAAAIVPATIAGIIDSKKITKEDERERIYEELIRSPGIRYAVAVISAKRIDEVNILQATLEGMRMAVAGVMNIDREIQVEKGNDSNVASAERNDSSYVITGGSPKREVPNEIYYALIDGNKVPKEMPCQCESLVKGDGREYSIGAASILAKVTRDRLMHEYDKMYPKYNLSQHKGYPTAAHMSAVGKFGASPIHRRTFAPLKHMKFDEHGNIM